MYICGTVAGVFVYDGGVPQWHAPAPLCGSLASSLFLLVLVTVQSVRSID